MGDNFLFSITQSPSERKVHSKGVHSKRGPLPTGSEFFPLGVDPFSEGGGRGSTILIELHPTGSISIPSGSGLSNGARFFISLFSRNNAKVFHNI